MPRRRRGLMDHSCYHVTHRCHKREFLFRFARDRQAYVDLMRETVNRFRIDVLNDVVTSHHVHLLVWAGVDHDDAHDLYRSCRLPARAWIPGLPIIVH
jgi:putative transposase